MSKKVKISKDKIIKELQSVDKSNYKTNKMNTKNYQMFCPECGAEVLRIPVPSEEAKVVSYAFGDLITFHLGSRFNKETGYRQFGIRVKCPNFRWYNNCTNYIDENSLHDSDIPQLLNL